MIEGILWVLFVLGCLLVSAVILLQDAKGGGLGEAFGGTGQQVFGVDNSGIAKFTAYMIVGLVLIAVVITKLRSGATVLDLPDRPLAPLGAPVQPGASVPAGQGSPTQAPPTEPKDG